MTPFDTNWMKGRGAAPLTTTSLNDKSSWRKVKLVKGESVVSTFHVG